MHFLILPCGSGRQVSGLKFLYVYPSSITLRTTVTKISLRRLGFRVINFLKRDTVHDHSLPI